MLILGIISIVVASVIDTREFDAASFSDQTQAQVAYAQKVAVAQRTNVYVIVNAPSQIRVCYDSGCASPVASPSGAAGFDTATPAGVSVSSSLTPFFFDPGGVPYNPGSPSQPYASAISITVSGGRTITVEPKTGYVHR